MRKTGEVVKGQVVRVAVTKITARKKEKVSSGSDNWLAGLDRTQNGAVRQTIANAVYALEYCPKLSGLVSYNELTASEEINGAPWKRHQKRITDTDHSFFYLAFEEIGITSRSKIDSAIAITANKNSFHPVREILEGLQWDGADHISELLPKYLGAERSAYTTIVTMVMFGGIISRQYCPGAKFDTAIVLVDEEQGGGKSSLARLLAIKDEWYTTLTNFNDPKVVVETMLGHIICEMPEMEGLVTAKSIEGVRSFLSRGSDTYRKPYDRHPQDIYRSSICIGTSNDKNFLPQDRAGNRRFIPVRCCKKNASIHPLENEAETRKDIMQCYAQAMTLYRKNSLPIKLPSEWEKKLPTLQKEFLPEDSKSIQIEKWILEQEDAIPKAKDAYCVAMIYKEALGNKGVPVQWESKEIALILDNLKYADGTKMLKRYEQSGGIKRIKNYGRCRAWVIADPDKMQTVLNLIKNGQDEQRASEHPDGFLPVPESLESEIPFP